MESTRHGIRGLREVFLAHLRSPRFLVWAGLLTAVSAILCFVPLFDLLGFEWCFALGLAAAPAAIDTARVLVHRVREDDLHALARPTSPARLTLALAGLATLQAFLLLCLPLAVIAANAFRVQLCDPWAGLAWFVVLPVPGVAAAAVVGLTAALCFRRRWLSSLAAQGCFLAMLALSVYRFYAAPPIFAYDALGGYFPGTLYDETLRIPPALGWYRLYTLAWLVAALAADGTPLAQWGSKGTRAGQFDQPVGIALDGEGNVYVAEQGNNRIQKLSPGGDPLDQWGSSGTEVGQFDFPIGVAVDARGSILVVESGTSDNSRIQKLVISAP